MNNKNNILNPVEIFGHIADLKTTDYKNTLAIATLINLLIDKNIITKEDLNEKAHTLDSSIL